MTANEKFSKLVEVMRKLRAPDGCPWDREQTHESIRPYCLEEAYEVVEAIDEGDMARLKDELGDLLLQVVFHAQMASERSAFTIDDVADAIVQKLIRRHPHVFRRADGDQVSSAGEVLERWAKIKKKEEGRENVLDGIPTALPSLLRAARIGEKAATVGFDWKSAADVWKKVEEELAETKAVGSDPAKLEEEFGDLLFALSNLARHLHLDAESATRMAVQKFERRFRWMEQQSRVEGKDLAYRTAEELDSLWNRAKRETAPPRTGR